MILALQWACHCPSRPVLCLVRKYPAHAAARVWPVAGVARDEVHMQVRHDLAGGRAVVDADVLAVWMELGIERGLGGG